MDYWQFVCLVTAACLICSRGAADEAPDLGNQSVINTDVNKTLGQQSCRLVAHSHYRDQLSQYVKGKSKLIEVTITLADHPKDMLRHVLKDVYKPYFWVRSISRQGRSLLTLDESYRYKSLSTLTIGIESLEINVTDSPRRCLRGLGQEDVLPIIRRSFLMNFGLHHEEKYDSSLEDRVCNIHIFRNGDYAEFRYRCCYVSLDDGLVCEDLVQDDWVKILLVLIIIIKVLVVLFSPLLLPDSLYRQKFVAGQYIYHLPGPPTTLKVVVTQDPDQFGEQNKHKTIRLSGLKNMEYFKTMVSNSSWIPEKVYEVEIQEVRLSVKSRRLLGISCVPVNIITILYNNLLRCRLRRLEPLKACCGTTILGRFNPGIKIVTWHGCLKVFAQFCMIVLLATPWVILVVLYFLYEAGTVKSKTQAAQEMGLKVHFPSSIILHLSPIHGVFIVIYTIFIIDSIVYGVISDGLRQKFKNVATQCLRDMRERSRVTVLAWITKLFVMPFQLFGILGLILFPPYFAILALVALPIAAFYIFPTLNLSLRLLMHLFIFMCPQRVTLKCEEWCAKLTTVKKYLNTREVTANENLPKRYNTCKGIVLQFIIVIMCLVSFWSLTLMIMEIISFSVEIFVYTFMGIVVNAGVTLHYLSLLIMVFIYSKNIFSRVHQVYQSYHKIIHEQLMEMKREEINLVATQEALDQENTAFIVQGDVTPKESDTFIPQIKIKNHKPQWQTSGMLLFLDKRDTPLTPEKFFHETIDLNYFGCPGPVYKNFCSALWEFLRIVLFLLFMFIVVMAFGDAYQISTTNQLLATVVGGLVPFLFRHIFISSPGTANIDTSSVQFKAEFHKAINHYTQSWPVFDIVPVFYKELEDNRLDTPNNNSSSNNKPGEEILPPTTAAAQFASTSSESSIEDAADDDGPAVTVDEDGIGGITDEVFKKKSSTTLGNTEVPEADIIVDISNLETRLLNPLISKDFERGSVSMLGPRHKIRGETSPLTLV